MQSLRDRLRGRGNADRLHDYLDHIASEPVGVLSRRVIDLRAQQTVLRDRVAAAAGGDDARVLIPRPR